VRARKARPLARTSGTSPPSTPALAVSRVLARDLEGDPARVRGVAVRFTGMVPLPSRLTVRGHAADVGGVAFDAIGPDGGPVLAPVRGD